VEAGMAGGKIAEPHYPTVEFVLDAIAGWINKYRDLDRANREFEYCSQDDVMGIARDLGLDANQLRSLAAKGPGAADTLQKMLVALSVDPKVLAESDPALMRDLQRLCIMCGQKGRCQHELARGTAAENFHEFCPNAYNLDALLDKMRSRSGESEYRTKPVPPR
jgi:hypothetical protein